MSAPAGKAAVRAACRLFAGCSVAALALTLAVEAAAQPAASTEAAPAAAAPPAAPKAMDSYEYAQRIRKLARAQAAPGQDAAGLAQAAGQLEGVLAYLDSPAVRDLATGNDHLYFRRVDVRLDLAQVYARMGRKDKAIDTLEGLDVVDWSDSLPRALASSPVLSPLNTEPRIQRLLATANFPRSLWAAQGSQPYKAVLSDEEKLAGLSLYWTQVRSDFVHFDKVTDLDWQAVYLDFIRQVLATRTTEDYYRVLTRLAPLLKDGHTNIYPPAELENKFYARPPVSTVRIGDGVYIDAVRSAGLRARLAVGERLLAIDGIAVDTYAQERVAPYVSSSTPQDKTLRTYSYQLLSGDAQAPLVLQLQAADGTVRSETVARSGYTDTVARERFTSKMLPGEIAYFSIDHFESDAGVKAFERFLPEVLTARGLVLDLRNNGGGSSSFGLRILSYLTNQPMVGANSYVRADTAFSRRTQTAITWKPLEGNGRPVNPRRDPAYAAKVYDGKVIVLIGPKSFSAAEDFLVSYSMLKRGAMIGEATGGSSGQPVMVYLPGGGVGRICVKRDTFPDGREFVGKGIAPDVPPGATKSAKVAAIVAVVTS